MLLLFFVIAASADATNPWFYLANFGVAGIVAGYFLYRWGKGQIGDNSERDRLRIIVDKVIADIFPAMQEQNRLNTEVTVKLIPLVAALLVALKEVERERDRLADHRRGE